MKSLTEISETVYKVILNTSIRSQNLCVYHVLCCRKRLTCKIDESNKALS